MKTWRWWLLLIVALAPMVQAASVNAFLDRDHVSLGHTVTLNIQSTDPFDTPDLSALQNDFQVLGTSRSSSTQIQNGHSSSRYQLGIALRPLHAGALTIPPLDVGSTRTQALVLHVGAAPSGGRGKVGDPVFMESSVRSSAPYVGQQTVYTVRLFYQPGVDGSLADPTADGARLIQLDQDHRYLTQRDGYTYRVIERSWALIPGRSGSISVQGPVFQGQRQGAGLPNGWLNDPNALLNSPFQGLASPVRAVAPTVKLDARAAPAQAGKPWLPARDIALKLTGLPSDGKARAGEPVTVTLSVSANGLPADALPELQLPPIPGARVYPDQVRSSSDDSGEWLQGTRTRSFAIVPERNGGLTIPAITLNWWDVVNDRARQARVPAHTLRVTGAATAGAASPAQPQASAGAGPASGASAAAPGDEAGKTAPGMPWRVVALASIALWALAVVVAALWWWMRRRGGATGVQRGAGAITGAAASAPVAPGGDANADHEPRAAASQAAKPDLRALQQQALAAARVGDAAACERALLAWARVSRPGLTSIGTLSGVLSDPAQRDALDALQRARWQGGDAASACGDVAGAFASGFAWREDDIRGKPKRDELPPLYPPV